MRCEVGRKERDDESSITALVMMRVFESAESAVGDILQVDMISILDG